MCGLQFMRGSSLSDLRRCHAHVHAVVPGGGPSLDGNGWRWSGRGKDSSSDGRYLVDADALRHRYRAQFLAGLDRLRAGGKLKLEGDFEYLQEDDAWKSFTDDLRAVPWVSYIEPPPRDGCSAEAVLKYLARYLTGGPISDARILSTDEAEVTFMAREGKTPGGASKQVPITLSTLEFTRRWSLHVLPKGYTKTRRFGGWSNLRRADYVELCSKQLADIGAPLPAGACDFGPFEPCDDDLEGAEESWKQCPKCNDRMILQEAQEKPSWHAVMASESRPTWYLFAGVG